MLDCLTEHFPGLGGVRLVKHAGEHVLGIFYSCGELGEWAHAIVYAHDYTARLSGYHGAEWGLFQAGPGDEAAAVEVDVHRHRLRYTFAFIMCVN